MIQKRSVLIIAVFLLIVTSISAQAVTINDVAWNADGSKIALATEQGIQVIDVQTGKALSGFQVDADVASVDWKPDGSELLSGQRDGIVDILDANTGRLISTFIAHQSFIDDISPRLSSVKWSPDGNRIVAVADSIDIPTTITIWNGTTYELLASFNASALADVQWKSDSSQVYVANSVGGAYAFDATLANVTESNINDFRVGYYDPALSIALNPNDTKLAVGSVLGNGNNINLWDIATEQYLYFLKGHSDFVYKLSWNPMNDMLASASVDGTVRIWDTNSGQQIDVIDVGSPVYTVAWSPNGTQFAYGGEQGEVIILDCNFDTPVPCQQANEISVIN